VIRLAKMNCALRGARLAQRQSVFFSITRYLYNRHIDYYDVLGVNKQTELKHIKVAYFKMAKKFHPDTNKTVDAKQMFELVAEAYSVLSDEERKRQYDETGESSERFGGRAQGPMRQSTDSTYTAEQMYTKIFHKENVDMDEQIERPGEDFAAHYSASNISREQILQLSLEESVTGVRAELYVQIPGVCNKCFGSKSEPGYTGNVCPYCEGTGEETMRTGHIIGRKQCSYCNGTKVFFKFKCIECEGTGRLLYRRPYFVDIPAGAEHGQVFRFELDPSVLNIPGEDLNKRVLFVTLNVQDSRVFKREGHDIHSYIRLSPAIALLGGKIEYKGLTRSCNLDVAPGTSSHSTLIVNQAGIHVNGLAGDHVLQSVIRVPKRLGWRQGRIMRRFAQLDVQDSGVINNISHELSHKYTVSVLTPDKVRNSIIKYSLHSESKPTLYKLYKEKLQSLRKRIQQFVDN